MSPRITLATDDPSVTVALTLGTIVGERSIDPGSHDEPPAYEPITLLDAIVERAAGQLVEQVTHDQWYGSMRKHVEDQRSKMIAEALAPMIADAVDAPIQRTTDYGRPIGDPVTMRELVIQAVHAEAAKALRRTNAKYDRDRSVLDSLVAETVPKVLAKELAAEVAQAKAVLRDAVAASASQVMADALSNVLKP